MKVEFTNNTTRNINFSSIADVHRKVKKFSDEAANIINNDKMFPHLRLNALAKRYIPSIKIENKFAIDNPCYGYNFLYDKKAGRFVLEKDKIKLGFFISEKTDYATSMVHEMSHAIFTKDGDVSKIAILNDLLKKHSVDDIRNIRKNADYVFRFIENSAIAQIVFDNCLLFRAKKVPVISDLQKELDKRVSNVDEKLLNALNETSTFPDADKAILRLVQNDAVNEVEAYNNEILFLTSCKNDKLKNIPLFFVAVYSRLAKLIDKFKTTNS